MCRDHLEKSFQNSEKKNKETKNDDGKVYLWRTPNGHNYTLFYYNTKKVERFF